MKTIVYLVRHGDVHNPNQVVYGRLPKFPLSEEGKRQAHRLGKHLSGKNLSAIYASPLERTKETAAIVASYHPNITVQFDTRLLEVHSPQFEGKSVAEAEKINWDFYREEFVAGGAESLEDLWKRMDHFLRDAIGKHTGQEIVVVSHGDPIMVSWAKHSGKPLVVEGIRGKDYVQRAKGFCLVFDEFSAIEVNKLDF